MTVPRLHKAEDLDVAVIDINLPGKSGIQLLQKLCDAEIYVPVIMITGEPNLSRDTGDRARGRL